MKAVPARMTLLARTHSEPHMVCASAAAFSFAVSSGKSGASKYATEKSASQTWHFFQILRQALFSSAIPKFRPKTSIPQGEL